jgi:predicted ferric reductase
MLDLVLLTTVPTRSTPVPVRPRRTAAGWLLGALWLNLLWVTDLFVLGGGLTGLSQPGALLTALGRLAGLYGALLLVAQLVLISRLPWIERRVGIDRLTAWHRWTGFWVLWLVVAHVVFIVVGYAGRDGAAVPAEIGTLVLDTQDVLKATVAFALLVGIAVTSARAGRRRMHYETWHFVHLYAYLAVVLGFFHQVSVGSDFVGSPIATAYWWTLYGAALAAVLVVRVGVPVARNLRHRLRVVSVVRESPQVVSVYVGGRHLDRLVVRSGQFFLWRFLTRDRWWEAHPYSLSALPDGRVLRITVKALGDGSARLRGLRPGTRVFAEGPYGAFTAERRTRSGVLLIGGGVGITPIRALMEEMAGRGDVTVVYRVNTPDDAVLLPELRWLAEHRGAVLYLVAGSPDAVGPHGPLLGPGHLTALAPDIRSRDVFVCGPPGLTDAVTAVLRELGVPREQCHAERFAFAT